MNFTVFEHQKTVGLNYMFKKIRLVVHLWVTVDPANFIWEKSQIQENFIIGLCLFIIGQGLNNYI